jgi:4-amino-4-deoxy-L-arabinose transferase
MYSVSFFQSSLRDEKKRGGTPFPAINCRAIFRCPYGTEELDRRFSNRPCGTKKKRRHPFPGNKLPGYFQMSLRDKRLPGYFQICPRDKRKLDHCVSGYSIMKKSVIALIAVFLLIYILPLGVRPLVIPDEPRYAEIPREMIAAGDWIVPRLNGLRYFEKPVMGYWLNALSLSIFGENAFAVRFPSAMSVGISALILLILARRFPSASGSRHPETGSQKPASRNQHPETRNQHPASSILPPAIFLTSFEVFGVGAFSVLDSMLSLFLTGAMAAFFLAYMENRPAKRRLLFGVFGGFCGFAFLTKGFLAFAVPAVSIVPFILWERRWKDLPGILVPSVIAIFLISLPWCIAVHLKESDFWHYFFWVEHIQRFASDKAQHAEPFWFYIPTLIGGGLPWTFLLPAAIWGLKKTRPENPLIRFSICWFLFPFLFFSASSGKLGTYILPCFPPLAILIAAGLLTYFGENKKKAFTAAALILAALSIMVALLLVISQLTDILGIKAYNPAETWKWILGTIALLIWASLLIFSVRPADFRKKMAIYCAAPLVLMFSAHFLIPDQTAVRKAPGEFLLRHQDKIQPDTLIVSHETTLHAVCWTYKRADVYLFMDTGELEYGLNYDDSKHRLLDTEQFTKLVNENSGKHKIVLISKARDYEKYRAEIPKPSYEDDNGGFVFAQF